MDNLSIREHAAIHAPISFRDVADMLPDFDMKKAGDRRGAIAVLARIRVEYADALMDALDGHADPQDQ